MVNDKNISGWIYINMAAVILAGIMGVSGYGELRAQVTSSANKAKVVALEVQQLQAAQNKQAVAIAKIEVTTSNIEKNQAVMQRSLETIANRLLSSPNPGRIP